MKYDFDTIYSRSGIGSSKWDHMTTSDGTLVTDVLPMSVADMEFKSPPEVIEALTERAKFGMWGYTYPTTEYFDAVIGWMKRRHNWTVERDWIVTFSGVVPAIFCAIRALTQKGDQILVQRPVYHPFFRAIEANERVLINNPLKQVGNTYEIDFADFEAKCKDPKTTFFLLCSPHNPVGRVWSKEDLERMAQICLDNGVKMFVDEIHSDFVYKPHVFTSFGTLDKKYVDNVIIGTAASKSFSLAGLTCCNIMVPNAELRDKLVAQQGIDSLSLNTSFGFLATQTCYEKGEAWFDQLLDYVWGNYEYTKEFFAKHMPKVKVYDLQGTYLAWVDMNGLGLDKDELKKFLFDECHFFVNMGDMFGEEGSGFIRIALVLPKKALADNLDRLLAHAKEKGLA